MKTTIPYFYDGAGHFAGVLGLDCEDMQWLNTYGLPYVEALFLAIDATEERREAVGLFSCRGIPMATLVPDVDGVSLTPYSMGDPTDYEERIMKEISGLSYS